MQDAGRKSQVSGHRSQVAGRRFPRPPTQSPRTGRARARARARARVSNSIDCSILIPVQELIERLAKEPIVVLDQTECDRLLESARVLREDDTTLAGAIRILATGDMIIVQERSPRGERYARAMPSREEADRFVDQRLAIYDKMWDGCGCKVDYTG